MTAPATESPPDKTNRTDRANANGANGAAPADQIQHVPLTDFVRSPFNRDIETKGPEWEEFVASIKQHGVIQPGVARPLPAAFDMAAHLGDKAALSAARKQGLPRLELVIGERRWLGSQAAKQATMPVIVRQLSDVQALELQALENDKRKDLNPIQEAQKYQQLVTAYEKQGMNKEDAIGELCKKLNKGKSTVYEALRLLKLPASVQDLVKANKLPLSHAGVLAQLEDAPDVQAHVAQIIIEKPRNENSWERRRDEQGLVSFRDAKALVKEQVELIGARKKWETAAASHRAKGGEVMSAEQMAKSVTNYGEVMLPFVGGENYTYDYSATGNRYSELMGKHAPRPILAHERNYKIIKCYRKKDVEEAIRKNGKKKRPTPKTTRHRGHGQVDQQKRKELARRMEPVVRAALNELLKVAETPKAKFPWGYFCGWVANVIGIYGDLEKEMLQRFGWKKVASQGYSVVDKTVAAHAEKLPMGKVQSLLLFLLLHDQNEHGPWNEYEGKFSESFKVLCDRYHVDLAKLTKELAPEPEKPKKKEKVQTPGSGSEDGGSKAGGSKKAKGGLTPAARKKLSEAMNARWAALRGKKKR